MVMCFFRLLFCGARKKFNGIVKSNGGHFQE
jgi:hypothetical protein